MHRSKPVSVGVIAEDRSDVESAHILIKKITGCETVRVKHFVGRGCGKIKRKARAWAENLKFRGCFCLILLHDLDQHNLSQLRSDLCEALGQSPIEPHLICIPVEELEAWWLTDPSAIKKALGLPKNPNVQGHPETIHSPKEYLSELVRRSSKNQKIYLNTKHNASIAKQLNLRRARVCTSFIPFHDFVSEHVKPRVL